MGRSGRRPGRGGGSAIQGEDGMGMRQERRVRLDEAQLARHPEVHNQNQVVLEVDEDVLPTPSQRGDAHARDRVDEHLRLRVPDDGWKKKIAADDGAAGKVRPEVRDDRLYFWQLGHLSSDDRELFHIGPVGSDLRLDLNPGLELVRARHDAGHLLGELIDL